MMKVEKFFAKEQKDQILNAIIAAEKCTSGEIRVHMENKCSIDVLDRASRLFDLLKMQKTKDRNGVLFYLAVEDRKFAILGDAGINAVTPDDFWDKIKETMLNYFIEGDFTTGLSVGIRMAGEALAKHFPYSAQDIDELSNDISFGQ